VSSRKFLIPTLLVAGFSTPSVAQEFLSTQTTLESKDEKTQQAAVSLFRQESRILLAGHSSHRSHSSHSSHRSSSGGGYYSPAPLYSPPPPPPPPLPARSRFQVPNTFLSTPSVSEPDAGPFIAIVKKVQLGLKSFGYYQGAIDGDVGSDTRAALTKLQNDYNLKVTGTITPEVLKALSVSLTGGCEP
jgi:His-Xaa-Ser repeat protein HxsA